MRKIKPPAVPVVAPRGPATNVRPAGAHAGDDEHGDARAVRRAAKRALRNVEND